jgi:DNA-binding phage protein
MSLIDYVLNHETFTSLADDLGEKDRKLVESQVKEMLENINEVYIYLNDITSTESGVEQLIEALEHAISTEEGQKEWLDKP